MNPVRRLAARHRGIAIAILVFAILARVLVPGGYMPMIDHGSIRIVICSGTQDGAMTMAMPGMQKHDGKPDHPAKDMPCGFSGLSFAAMSAADPALLVLAIVFAMVLAASRVAPLLIFRAPSLRPPPRGPPAHI